MKYYKLVKDGYIPQIGIDCGGTEITKAEYDEIRDVIADMPTPPSGYGYRLKTDLTWELFELPPDPDDPTVEDKAEAFDIITGVS